MNAFPPTQEFDAVTRYARRTLIAASTVALAMTAGCATVMTDQPFAPSDGIRVDLSDGQALVNNLFIVTNGPCEPGVLAGSITSAVAQQVEIEFLPVDDATVTASPALEECADSVPETYTAEFESSGTVFLTRSAYPDQAVVLGLVPAIPGGMVAAEVTASVSGSAQVRIPVLDGKLSEYKSLAELAAQQ